MAFERINLLANETAAASTLYRGCLLFSAPRRVATTGTDMLLVSQTRLDACLGSTPFGIKLINFDRHTTSYMLGV